MVVKNVAQIAHQFVGLFVFSAFSQEVISQQFLKDAFVRSFEIFGSVVSGDALLDVIVA